MVVNGRSQYGFAMPSFRTAPALVILLPALIGGLGGCGWNVDDAESSSQKEIVVFAAASLTDALTEAADGFEAATKVNVQFNFAGSNVLARQLDSSSKADVFVSADEHWMNHAAANGRIREQTRSVFLSNTLVLIGPAGTEHDFKSPKDLCNADFRLFIVGDPDAVPAGRYTRDWLSEIPCKTGTVWDSVQARLSPIPNTRAALAQISSTPEVLGAVYRTDYLQATNRVKLLYELPRKGGPKIQYNVAITSDSDVGTVGAQFVKYLQSRAAALIFERHGFIAHRESE